MTPEEIAALDDEELIIMSRARAAREREALESEGITATEIIPTVTPREKRQLERALR